MQVNSISEQLLFSTVRIETESSTGKGAGTAFFINYENNGENYIFLVTNKHVIKETNVGKFFFTLRDGNSPIIGKRFDVTIEDFSNGWFNHQSPEIDVSIMPLGPLLYEIKKRQKEVFFKSIPVSLIPSQQELNELDAIEDVVFVGYPNGLFDNFNLMPIVRKGITATHVSNDYGGQPKFLIDASVFPGSSGSPVLIINQGGYSHRGGLTLGTSRILFLGILCQVFTRTELGNFSIVPAPQSLVPIITTKEMIDLGIVIRAEKILEVVKAFLRNQNIGHG